MRNSKNNKKEYRLIYKKKRYKMMKTLKDKKFRKKEFKQIQIKMFC